MSREHAKDPHRVALATGSSAATIEAMTALLDVVVADITTLDVDAIVNAANSGLSGGGGVDGAIHRAAGPELAPAARAAGPCPTGHAVMTPGFRLPARYVIHAVGPVWEGGDRDEAAALASCYAMSLALAGAAGLRSIAFPAISTGVYGFPKDRAARIAHATVRREIRGHASLERVIFCCFSEGDAAIHRELLDALA
jgi:O-acetyl-ADP-ribose deacetylase (regulator of RNase III)